MEGEKNDSQSQQHPQSLGSTGKLRGRTSTRSSNPVVTSDMDMAVMEKVVEHEEDDHNSFDHEDDMSEESLHTESGSTKSKHKIARGKRADCWNHFKVINVPSKSSSGVMETKAKCKFFHRSYAYRAGGATTTLNRHLAHCTQYLNKLAKAKVQVKVKRALIGAQQSGDPILEHMAAAMLEKFDKYWEEKNNIMVIATILDPRFKMRYIRWCFAQIFEPMRCDSELNDITRELERLYNKYETLHRQKMGDISKNKQSTSSSLDTTSSMASFASDFQSFLQSNDTESSKSELLIYLDEANEPIDNKHFNLLRYWSVNCHRFPVVSTLAKRFLAVPVSSVSSESTFSTAGRVLDDYRSSLKPATVQALLCACSWLKGPFDVNNLHVADVGDVEEDVESIDFPTTCAVASN